MDTVLKKKGHLLNLLSQIDSVEALTEIELFVLDLMQKKNKSMNDDTNVVAEKKSDDEDIFNIREETVKGYQPASDDDLLRKYAGRIEPTFDLDKIAAEQGITSFDLAGFEELAEKADIQEDIDTLLSLID